MGRIVLKDIVRVYRFSILADHWEREIPANDHFIAYKLNGYTLHEHQGCQLPFGRDMLMVANCEDTYRVTRHEWEQEGAHGGCIAVHFTTVEPFGMHLSVYDCSAHPQVRSVFFQMLDAWKQWQSGRNLAAEYQCVSCFYSILSWVCLLEEAPMAAADDRIAAAKEYIDRNYANSALTIADAARVAGLGQRRFGELFLAHVQTTPGNYLTARRIAAATALLRDSRYSVADIASVTGYASASYFIRIFRQKTGKTPAQLRQELRD